MLRMTTLLQLNFSMNDRRFGVYKSYKLMVIKGKKFEVLEKADSCSPFSSRYENACKRIIVGKINAFLKIGIDL